MDNLLGELCGTAVLCAFGCGVNANMSLSKTYGKGGGWICIALGWGLAVLFGVFTSIALGAPQADINPSVTLAKTLAGVYTMPQAISTMIVQVIGGVIGAAIVWLIYLPHWAETEDKGTKLGVFATGPAIPNTATNFLCEMLATFFLMTMIWAVFYKANGPLVPGYGPYMVNALIWAIGFSFGGVTGYSMNMARDLGPRIAHAILPIAGKGGSNWGYAWIPSVAPLCGGALAYVVATALHLI